MAFSSFSQPVAIQRVIDDSLSVSDFYYRKFSEINGFILKILKENGRGDGNYTVMDYVDLNEKGFLRREKFKLQYFDNNLQKKWEINLPPEQYISVPKPFYQITANERFIYFFESGASDSSTNFTCKVTQLNYEGEIVRTSQKQSINMRIFTTFPSDWGLQIVGHRFAQKPEYCVGTFQWKSLSYSQKDISLPHTKKEISNWSLNKSAFEDVPGGYRNNSTWLRKAYIIYPMSEDEAIYTQYIKINAQGTIVKKVEVPYDITFRNYLGIDTECYESLDRMPAIVLRGAKTGPFFDVYMKNLNDQVIYHKELHFYDIWKKLRDGYPYYDYREINYNHYRNVDHFKAIIYDHFNKGFILVDKVPDGAYFFHVDKEFDLRRIDYAKEFSGNSVGASQYSIGIISGLSTIYQKEGYYPRKTALDFIMKLEREDPRKYYYTIFSRAYYQVLIVEDLVKGKTTAYKLTK